MATQSTVKTYVLDTNILIEAPYSIYAFDEHHVIVTDTTVEELDRLKDRPGETGANAREAIRVLDSLRGTGNLLDGISLPMGQGIFRIVPFQSQKIPNLSTGWNTDSPDNRILFTAKALQNSTNHVIVVSNDANMRIKADIIGLPAEEFRTDRVKPGDQLYTGRAEYYTYAGAIQKFYETGHLLQDDLYQNCQGEPEIKLIENEFLILHDAVNSSEHALGMYRNGRIEKLRYADEKPYDVTPRNAGQRFMQEMLLAPVDEFPLVIVKGGAGTAKTFYSLACGLEQVMTQKAYKRILVARPNIKFDDDIGYLKGGEEDKIAPLIRPIMDNLELLAGIRGYDDPDQADIYIQSLFESGRIVAQAMAYMRGRSITNTWIMLDEFQNANATQAFGIVSRAGVGSKVILLGDPEQIDNPRLDSKTNGLVFAAERMKGSPLCAQITLEPSECTRSKLALSAIDRMSPKGMRIAK